MEVSQNGLLFVVKSQTILLMTWTLR